MGSRSLINSITSHHQVTTDQLVRPFDVRADRRMCRDGGNRTLGAPRETGQYALLCPWRYLTRDTSGHQGT